jgi:hypothetical protein
MKLQTDEPLDLPEPQDLPQPLEPQEPSAPPLTPQPPPGQIVVGTAANEIHTASSGA